MIKIGGRKKTSFSNISVERVLYNIIKTTMSTVEERKKLREDKRRTSKMVSKLNSEETNPCFKEEQLSSQCFLENNCDREICSPYIANYQVCKKFWSNVMSARRRKGIKPYLPPVEERAKVVDDYFISKAQIK